MPIDRTSSSFTAKRRDIRRRNILFWLLPSLGIREQPTRPWGNCRLLFFAPLRPHPHLLFLLSCSERGKLATTAASFFESTRPLFPSTPVTTTYYFPHFASFHPTLQPTSNPLLFPAREREGSVALPFQQSTPPPLNLTKSLCPGSVDIFLPPVVDRPPAETSSALSTCFHQVGPLLKLSHRPRCFHRADDTAPTF